jgi:hypothetical protein
MDAGFPLIMLVGPAVAAVVALIVRRRRRVTVILGLVTLGLLTLLLWLAGPDGLFTDNTIAILGREAVLTPLVRSLFLLVYPALALLFLVTWFRPGGLAIVPLGLAALSPLAAALMVSPAGFGTVLILAATAVLIPALYAGRYDVAAATWRYFALTAVAVAPLLLLISPSPEGTPVSWFVPLLAATSLLGSFPFHTWVGGLGRRSPYPALALALGLTPIVVVVLLQTFVDSAPAVRGSVEFQAAIRWSAILSALVAAFQVARAADWRGVVAGLLVLDAGLLAAITLAPGTAGLIIALPALIGRFLSLLLLAMGLGWATSGDPPVDTSSGRWSWVAKLPALAAFYGLLSLIGLPLTPGFAGRWAEVALVAGGGAWSGLLPVLSLAAATVATLRFAKCSGVNGGTGRALSRGGLIFTAILLGLAVLVGLFPDLIINTVSRLLGG